MQLHIARKFDNGKSKTLYLHDTISFLNFMLPSFIFDLHNQSKLSQPQTLIWPLSLRDKAWYIVADFVLFSGGWV
ncbi:hypothetical protein JHK85_015287 [Glycine max]|nr:hypothetical protein JHK85_015287 [Glycine max]